MKTFELFSIIVKRIFFLLYLSLLGVLVVSCEDFFISDVTGVSIPGSEPQLVVYSYISPQDTLVKVYLNYSMPNVAYHGQFPDIKNAVVQIAPKGGEFVVIPYNKLLNTYSIDTKEFQIRENQHYVLKVETSNGYKVDAECFVPALNIEDISIQKPYFVKTEYGYEKLLLDWQVISKGSLEEQYYRSSSFLKLYELHRNYNRFDTLYQGVLIYELERGQEFVQNTQGMTHNFKAELWLDWKELSQELDMERIGDFMWFRKDSLFIYVIQSDYNYYTFHKSVQNYDKYDDDFPFGESIRIYTNIKGGLGVFGGYNFKEIYINPKDL